MCPQRASIATIPDIEDLNGHVRRARWVLLVEGVCKDPGDSQTGMFLDVLHGCGLGFELGVAFDGDSGCPTTPVGELKQANNVVCPAGKQDKDAKAIASTEKRAVAGEGNKGKKWEEPEMEMASAPFLLDRWKEMTKKLNICF